MAGAPELLARRMKGRTRFGWAGGGGGGGALFPSLARAASADSEVDAGKCRPVDDVAEVDDGDGDESGATIPSRRLRRLSLSLCKTLAYSECLLMLKLSQQASERGRETPPRATSGKTRSRLVAYFGARDSRVLLQRTGTVHSRKKGTSRAQPLCESGGRTSGRSSPPWSPHPGPRSSPDPSPAAHGSASA